MNRKCRARNRQISSVQSNAGQVVSLFEVFSGFVKLHLNSGFLDIMFCNLHVPDACVGIPRLVFSAIFPTEVRWPLHTAVRFRFSGEQRTFSDCSCF